MSIAATTTNTSTDATALAANAAKTTSAETPAKKELSAYQASLQNRQTLNSQILSSSLNLSLKSDNQSMSLLFKTALEKVQAEFSSSDEVITAQESPKKTESKADAKTYETEVDNSAKATSERIVGLAAGFYQKFKERNPNDAEALTKFMDKFSSGVDKGFADAKDILKSLDKLNGKVAADIDETYGLVQKGLKSFQEKMMEEEASAKSANTGAKTKATTA